MKPYLFLGFLFIVLLACTNRSEQLQEDFNALKSDVQDGILTDYSLITDQAETLKNDIREYLSTIENSQRKEKKTLAALLNEVDDFRKKIVLEEQDFNALQRLAKDDLYLKVEKANTFFKTHPKAVKTEEVNQLLEDALAKIKEAIENHALLPPGYLTDPKLVAEKSQQVIDFLHQQGLTSKLSKLCDFSEAQEKLASASSTISDWQFSGNIANGTADDIRKLLRDLTEGIRAVQEERKTKLKEVLNSGVEALLQGKDASFLRKLELAAAYKRTLIEHGSATAGLLKHTYYGILPEALAPVEISESNEQNGETQLTVSFQIVTKRKLTNSSTENVMIDVMVKTVTDANCEASTITYFIEGEDQM
ncbi:hypothetical protein [Lewinella sp. LCG006]|uniref:hypothetical protein n=1 Tax=Lewinella sp. LCG006 TaxID=3231911 RepID=UPI00345FD969